MKEKFNETFRLACSVLGRHINRASERSTSKALQNMPVPATRRISWLCVFVESRSLSNITPCRASCGDHDADRSTASTVRTRSSTLGGK